MTILLLPEEILLQIASYFTSDDLFCFSSSSKSFRRICFPLFRNNALHIPNIDIDSCLDIWSEWKVKKIVLNLNKNIIFNHFDSLLKNVIDVEIINGKENWEEFIMPYLDNFSINKLIIKYSVCKIGAYKHEYTNAKFDMTFFKSKFLYQTNRNFSQHECFPKIKLCNKKLIEISDCIVTSVTNKKICNDDIDKILCYQHYSCKNALTHINLDGTQVTDRMIVIIADKYPKLNHLSLKNCYTLSGAIVNIIGKLISLDYLSISGVTEIKSLVGLSTCSSLKKLDVSNCKRLTDITCIMDIIANLTFLKLAGIPASLEILCVYYLENLLELDVQNCYQISDNLLSRLKMPNVRILNVSSCVRITGETLKCVVCSSEKLNNLNLSWLKKISVSFFEETAQLSKLFWRIEKLYLSNMNINDDCLAIIQSCNPISLKTLHVSLCKTITDKGILTIALISTIEDLNISHLCNITDHSMTVLASRLCRMKSFNITGCIKLTDKSIESLKVCKQLSSLECTQCRLLHDQAIKELNDSLPKLNNIRYVKDMSFN